MVLTGCPESSYYHICCLGPIVAPHVALAQLLRYVALAQSLRHILPWPNCCTTCCFDPIVASHVVLAQMLRHKLPGSSVVPHVASAQLLRYMLPWSNCCATCCLAQVLRHMLHWPNCCATCCPGTRSSLEKLGPRSIFKERRKRAAWSRKK